MDKEVQRYLDTTPENRRRIIDKLHDLIIGLYPDAEIVMWYRMPTYKAKGGWVALANQKHYVSLYTCDPRHIAEFKAGYPTIKTGKACINLRETDPIPSAALKKVIRHAIEQSG